MHLHHCARRPNPPVRRISCHYGQASPQASAARCRLRILPAIWPMRQRHGFRNLRNTDGVRSPSVSRVLNLYRPARTDLLPCLRLRKPRGCCLYRRSGHRFSVRLGPRRRMLDGTCRIKVFGRVAFYRTDRVPRRSHRSRRRARCCPASAVDPPPGCQARVAEAVTAHPQPESGPSQWRHSPSAGRI